MMILQFLTKARKYSLYLVPIQLIHKEKQYLEIQASRKFYPAQWLLNLDLHFKMIKVKIKFNHKKLKGKLKLKKKIS